MTTKAHDIATIEAFVVRERRERYLTLLSSQRGRAKLRQVLPHFQHLDCQYAQLVSASDHSPSCVAALLRREGAPATCYLLSEDSELDGCVMNLDEALEAVVGRGMGTFVSCVPGELAYFEGETAAERYLLKRAV